VEGFVLSRKVRKNGRTGWVRIKLWCLKASGLEKGESMSMDFHDGRFMVKRVV